MTDLTVDVLRDVAAFEAVAADWERLCVHPEAHPALVAAVLSTSPSLIRPHVVVVRRSGAVIALAVARIEREPVPVGFGVSILWAPRLNVVRLSYDGLFGDLSPPVFERLAEALAAPVRAGEADALFLDHVRPGAAEHAWAASPGMGLSRDLAPARDTTHWLAHLMTDFPTFLKALSKSERANFKKRRVKIEAAFGPRVRFACYSRLDDAKRAVADMRAVAERSYHRALGVGFADNAWAEPQLAAALAAGIARSYVLYLDEAPVAFITGFGWQQQFHTCFMGYDPTHAVHGFGGEVVARMVADLCAEGRFDAINFGFGDAAYKRRLGDESWTEVDRYVFARRPMPLFVNLLRGVTGHTARLADRVLQKVGLRERIKALWYRRAIAKGNGGPIPSTQDRPQTGNAAGV